MEALKQDIQDYPDAYMYERAQRLNVSKSGIEHALHGKQDWHAKGRTNAIGALIGKSLLTASLFRCNITSDVFNIWVKYDLLPKLKGSVIIVMDNATFHRRSDTQDMIEQAGHELVYLPAYSPELNPIERKWAQLKDMRRKIGCCIDELFSIESFYTG